MVYDDKDDQFDKITAILATRDRAVLKSPLGINFAEEVACETISSRSDSIQYQHGDSDSNVPENVKHDFPRQCCQEERCSFCGRTESEVSTLVKAASGSQICNVCVNDCLQILKNDE